MKNLLQRLLDNSYELRSEYVWKKGHPRYQIELDWLNKDIAEAENMIKMLDGKNRQVDAVVKPTLAELSRYTNRIVVVDHRQGSSDYGRTIDAWRVKLEFDWQDYGKTLKIFVNDR